MTKLNHCPFFKVNRFGLYESQKLKGSVSLFLLRQSVAIYMWIEFFSRSFELMKNSVSKSKHTIDLFIRQSEPKQKEVLVELMMTFKQNVTLYNSVFIEGFLNILQMMDGTHIEDVSARYNDELRVRYNEITSKFEDFLKRAQRELGETFEQTMPRAREFRHKEKT